METYDFIVLGGGSGGVRAARIAATHGARVALLEQDRLGGTCVIRGCVPKKLLVYASQYGEGFKDAQGFGWTSAPAFDWDTLRNNKDREIKRLEEIYTNNLRKAGVELYASKGSFEDAHTIRVEATGARIAATHSVIATGGRILKDAIPEGVAPLLMTSDDLFDLPALPKRVAIVGGGYIAVECAGILNGLGVDTILLYRGEQILRGFDREIRTRLFEEMGKRGVKIHLHEEIVRALPDEGVLELKTGEILHGVDRVLWAAGRAPNTEGLGLDRAKVAIDHRGAVAVNDRWQSLTQPHIYAIGDVVNTHALTPLAIAQGHALADALFGKRPWKSFSQTLIPTAVFSQPELATVGLGEDEARAQYAHVRIHRSAFRPMRHALSGRTTQTFMKLVVDGATDRLLGAHLLGEGSAELIQLLATIMEAKLTKADLDRTLAVHPTSAEELVTMP